VRPGKTVYEPTAFGIAFGWKAMIKAIFPTAIEDDLLRLVHPFNSLSMLPA